jgi:hypothetical protein
VTCLHVLCLLVSSPACGATMVSSGYAWAQDVTDDNHVQGGVTSVQCLLCSVREAVTGRSATKTWLFGRAWQTWVRLFSRGFRCSRSERLRCGWFGLTPCVPGHQRAYGFAGLVAS